MTMRLDIDDDDDSDGEPQPASQALTYGEAVALSERTDKQLMPFLHRDGKWYCYDARTPKVGITPKVPIVP